MRNSSNLSNPNDALNEIKHIYLIHLSGELAEEKIVRLVYGRWISSLRYLFIYTIDNVRSVMKRSQAKEAELVKAKIGLKGYFPCDYWYYRCCSLVTYYYCIIIINIIIIDLYNKLFLLPSSFK